MKAPATAIDCPPDIIEVRRNDDGSLDEIVAFNCFVHLEQMSPGVWWLGVAKDGYRQVAHITAVDRDMCGAYSEMDDCPTVTASHSMDHDSTLPQRLRGEITTLTLDANADMWRLRSDAADLIERQQRELLSLREKLNSRVSEGHTGSPAS